MRRRTPSLVAHPRSYRAPHRPPALVAARLVGTVQRAREARHGAGDGEDRAARASEDFAIETLERGVVAGEARGREIEIFGEPLDRACFERARGLLQRCSSRRHLT